MVISWPYSDPILYSDRFVAVQGPYSVRMVAVSLLYSGRIVAVSRPLLHDFTRSENIFVILYKGNLKRQMNTCRCDKADIANDLSAVNGKR